MQTEHDAEQIVVFYKKNISWHLITLYTFLVSFILYTDFFSYINWLD